MAFTDHARSSGSAVADGLVQLVYISAARPLFTHLVVRDILTVSRRNNARDDISGILLYKSGAVLQVLEGPGFAVDRLYGNIVVDPRHHRVTCLYRKPIKQREFTGWHMAFRNLDLDEAIEPFPEGYSHLLEDDMMIDPRFDHGARKVLADFLSGIR